MNFRTTIWTHQCPLVLHLKDRFFRVDLDKGFARVRSKVESVVSSQSLEANVGLGEGDLVDGSLAKELSKLGTEQNAQRLRPSASLV